MAIPYIDMEYIARIIHEDAATPINPTWYDRIHIGQIHEHAAMLQDWFRVTSCLKNMDNSTDADMAVSKYAGVDIKRVPQIDQNYLV